MKDQQDTEKTTKPDDTDWLKLGRNYLAHNAAESGADVIIEGLCAEMERLRALLREVCSECDRFEGGHIWPLSDDLTGRMREFLPNG